MSKTQPKPILNTSLPPQFRQIRIELAREPGHPEGEPAVAYVIVAPLSPDSLIDPEIMEASPRGLPGCAPASRRAEPAWSSRIPLRRRMGLPL